MSTSSVSAAAFIGKIQEIFQASGSEAERGSLRHPSAKQELQKLLPRMRSLGRAHEEPVRTVHHFACAGGTLISKCLAVMPNVQLLSEIDPLSRHTIRSGLPVFAPTDLITLMRQGTRRVDENLEIELFRDGLQKIYKSTSSKGQRLVLRDHAHSHFCSGPVIPDRPTLREILPASMNVVSLVTVRDPLDSYASLQANKWKHFEPNTFDEYCRRYLAFLDRYQDVHIEKYEVFVAEPEQALERMCNILRLPYRGEFQDIFPVLKITGDSGRSGSEIKPRPRRDVASELAAEAGNSPHYALLARRLDYEAQPAGKAQ